jgi:hypothetical protein
MATVQQGDLQQAGGNGNQGTVEQFLELKIISHSPLMYWWPVWVLGYVFALLTFLQGEQVTVGGRDYLFHPEQELGVIYTVVFMLVILITNVTLRGMMSVLVIVSALFFTVLFAWLGWWDNILSWLPYLGMHMNLGFYLFFSTAVFIAWALAVFFFDRLEYWRVRPGQMTFERMIGGGERSYDTRGMVFEKHLEDFFRHWILGLGSGDLMIKTSGARSEEIFIPNVAFVDRKVKQIQTLVAIKPDEHPDRMVAAGTPG